MGKDGQEMCYKWFTIMLQNIFKKEMRKSEKLLFKTYKIKK